MSNDAHKKIVQFLYEIGTMKKLPRIHRQVLLTDDLSDTIASHSYRVTLIGWFLAKMEGADVDKTIKMCLVHDTGEVRSNDHHWIHKRYIKVFDEEIKEEQLGTLPFADLKEVVDEYDKRESKEAIIAKDADLVDQIFLLREYAWQGNREAQIWLDQIDADSRYKTESAKVLTKVALAESPSSWWENLATSKNR